MINDGGPAFPVPEYADTEIRRGMSMRDWFAGQALIGLLVKGVAIGAAHEQAEVASWAFELADDMVKESLKK